MDRIESFREKVAMKFQLYNGLLFNLPVSQRGSAGILLPLFTQACSNGLNKKITPKEIVNGFLQDVSDQPVHELLFEFLRLIERQVVLFDSLEDAGFKDIHDVNGPGTLQDVLNRIERFGKSNDFSDLLASYQVRLVLTAHPTQFYTDEVLGILTDLAYAVEHNEVRNVHDYLLQLAHTRFKNRQKPTPLEEAKSLMWILKNVFYQIVPGIHRGLVEQTNLKDMDKLHFPARIRLGFWPGGDRDGNPFVTADITARVASMLRRAIVNKYLDETKRLTRRITFGDVQDDIVSVRQRLQSALESCADGVENAYLHPDELLNDLFSIYKKIETTHSGLFLDQVANFIYTVQSFGFHFATLDVRQDSSVHDRLWKHVCSEFESFTIEELIKKITGMAVPERRKIVDKLVDSLNETDPESADVLLSLFAIYDIQRKNGEAALHRYIISNSQSPKHILQVLLYAMLCSPDQQKVTIDIVPLFETIDDLHGADDIMSQVYDHPWYQNHLRQRGNEQTIMLGFSDGTKDGGYFTANWEIYRAKERLTAMAKEHGVRVSFFDGRGGPPARGGGNTHKFYRSLGPEIDSRSIQVTIQGQTVSSMYGTEIAAAYNLEQIVSAGIDNNLFHTDQMNFVESDRALLDRVSQLAKQTYMSLRDDPVFIQYLEKMTPMPFYGLSNIGSRPVKRGNAQELRLKDLRAIPFVGGWSQSKLNIPGYFGMGTALKTIEKEGLLKELQDLVSHSMFFRAILENSMQSLSKANLSITQHHSSDPVFGDFWSIIRKEAELTRDMLMLITGQKELLENDPVNRESIAMREKMIIPSLVIQQYALSEIRDNKEADRQLMEKMVVKSLAIGVNAGRNSV